MSAVTDVKSTTDVQSTTDVTGKPGSGSRFYQGFRVPMLARLTGLDFQHGLASMNA